MTSPLNNSAVHSDTGDLADQIKRLHDFRWFDAAVAGSAPVAVVPDGKKLQSLKPFLDENLALPRRRRGTARLDDVGSFIDMVARFKSANSAIFANPNKDAPAILAVFDYSPAGPDATVADWLAHRALYNPAVSQEWKAWNQHDGAWMNQAGFASFVEDRLSDLIVAKLDDPNLKTFADLVEGTWANPSDMVRLSRGLQVNVESVVKNAQMLNSGEISIVFEEIHKDGAGEPMKIPTLFTIAIPVFYAGVLYRIAARLRYRVGGGKISWMYQLVRPDTVFDYAFNELVSKVKTDTQAPVFIGTPES